MGDGAVVLLNPKVVTPEGEWETWFFANWLPGAVRYRSLAEWLADERRTCSKQLKPLPKAKVKEYVTAKKPVSVKKAQAAARSGQTELALESLEPPHRRHTLIMVIRPAISKGTFSTISPIRIWVIGQNAISATRPATARPL